MVKCVKCSRVVYNPVALSWDYGLCPRCHNNQRSPLDWWKFFLYSDKVSELENVEIWKY